MLLPEVIPRLKTLFASGFGYIAFLMAQIYNMVRLLPKGHPYLDPQNIGLFGIRHVIAAAANNLVFKRQNADQIVIFGAMLVGTVLLAVQLFMIVFGMLFTPAMAQIIAEGSSMFNTPNPSTDIAYMLLDQVFGIPGLYNSCIATATLCPGASAGTPASFPWPFHVALHELFRFYSMGILFIGILIFLYFVVIVIGETATTGTPFGQRFQNVWVPIRLVMAIGLLIPLNYGMNSGQYITLFIAKYGSSFATNAWIRYNNTIAQSDVFADGGANPTGERESLIGYPTPPDIAPVAQAMSLVHTCAFAYWYNDNTISRGHAMPPDSGFYVQPYLVKQAADWMEDQEMRLPLTGTTKYEDALKFYNNSDITIRFGRNWDLNNDGNLSGPGESEYFNKYAGYVEPLCGDIRISIKDLTSISEGATERFGPEAVQEYYFDLIKTLWFAPVPNEYTSFARRVTALNSNIAAKQGGGLEACGSDLKDASPFLPPNWPSGSTCSDVPTLAWKQNVLAELQSQFETRMITIWDEYVTQNADMEMTADILERGWGGAGIWFNKISQLNGAYMESVIDFPKLIKYPLVMEQAREERRREDTVVSGIYQFQPNLAGGRASALRGEALTIATILSGTFIYWNAEGAGRVEGETVLTGNAVEDAINLIFGAEGLFAMTGTNNHVHPLAQLTMLGKGLVEASIRNVAIASIGSAVGGLLSAIEPITPRLVEPFLEFIQSTAFIGLTAGLVLYYILPFLPFIYFYFAVAGWVKSIFEAMVGTPLWALAHLRIDGEGLPGNSASNGYFLLLEIFLRPILSVFGLIAAIVIFTAQVRVLHFLWSLVTQNLAGYEGDPTIGFIADLQFSRTIVDELFFTIIYAIIVYMMAIAAFKLIDKIPDNILRWIGGSVSTFSDINQDSVESLTRFAALGGNTAGREIAGGIKELGGGVGGAIGKAFRGDG